MTPSQQAQIAYCRQLLREGKTTDYLIGMGYGRAAIIAAQQQEGGT